MLDRVDLDSGGLRLGDSAVIVVDMQPGFINTVEINARRQLVSAQQEVLQDISRKGALSAIVMEDVSQDGEVTDGRIKSSVEAQALRKVYLSKKRNDAFTNPMVESYLKAWKIRRIVLMGLYANYCVFETAQSAIDKGFRVHTAKQLIANEESPFVHFSEWYRENTDFHEDYRSLLPKI